MGKIKNIKGNKYGKLTVISFVDVKNKKELYHILFCFFIN